MTDDPPREWPPLTVWAAAGLLAGPPSLLTAAVLLHGGEPAAVWVTGVWLTAAGANALRLLTGVASGVRWAAVLLGCLALFPAAMIAGLWSNAPARHVAWAFAPLAYLVAVAALLWWPATRVWCGLLQPPHPDDE